MNHPQAGLQQPIHHHQQNFFSGGPIPQSSLHHYPQQNQHHSHHQPHHHQRHQPPLVHHAPPLASHHSHIQHGIGRNSPYYPNILQTEFRIIELNRRLQCRPATRHPVNPLPSPHDETLWWERFASEFFEDDATLTLRTHEDKPVEYTIGRTLIPRFFKTYFDGGVTDLSINLRNPKEACIHPQMITLDCDQAFIVTNNIFRHPAIAPSQGVVVHTEGHLILDFVSNNFDTLSIKSWRFYTKGSREYIDRSILTTMGMPSTYLAEPVTRNGLTKSTISYLKMCMIMEPMQDLMFQHKQTKMDPRSCLRKLLFDRYKFRSGDDNRVPTNKRRKRKPSAAPAITGGTATNKKSKANVTNSLGNNSGLNNNIIMSPSGAPPSFFLASQDVMVVGEPSMMGGDFGDDNERMITRLENTQYDPTASTPSNAEESDSMNASAGNDNGISNSNSNSNIDSNIENHIMSPSLLQQRQQQPSQALQMPHHTSPQHHRQQTSVQQQSHHPSALVGSQQTQVEHSSSQMAELQHRQHQPQQLQMNVQDMNQEDLATNQVNLALIERQQELDMQPQQQPVSQDDETSQLPHMSAQEQTAQEEPQSQSREERPIEQDETDQQEQQQPSIKEETKVNSITLEPANDSNLMLGINSVGQAENHANSIQPLNDESNSNSQLSCSTATATSAMEQQQPVDNGVA